MLSVLAIVSIMTFIITSIIVQNVMLSIIALVAHTECSGNTKHNDEQDNEHKNNQNLAKLKNTQHNNTCCLY